PLSSLAIDHISQPSQITPLQSVLPQAEVDSNPLCLLNRLLASSQLASKMMPAWNAQAASPPPPPPAYSYREFSIPLSCSGHSLTKPYSPARFYSRHSSPKFRVSVSQPNFQ